MLIKEIIDNTLYIFYRGRLIYKKWLNTGESAVFGLHGEVFRNDRKDSR